MNLLHLLGEYRRPAALVGLVLAVLVLAFVGVGRLRAGENGQPASPPAAAARATPPPSASQPTAPPTPTSAPPTPDPEAAGATAMSFCQQYFANSWQETAAQEQARVAPYLTAKALAGWRAQLTPLQVSAHQVAQVTGCSVTDEGATSGAQLGFFLDAQVVTTSTAGTQTQTAAAEVFLVAAAGAWKVAQVRS